MSASIAWTDDVGSATLTNGKPRGRFSSWAPLYDDAGVGDHELGSGFRHFFAFGDRYGASFALEHIPATSHALMTRLVRHLHLGGTIDITTGDGTHTYPTCSLWQGVAISPPQLTERDVVEYTMQFSVLNAAASPVPMECYY